MENDDDDMLNAPLSDDFEENLRMENELLRLKMKAELGSDLHSTGESDPELENAFLKHIMAFEDNYAKSKRIKVFDLLDQPDFKNAGELDDEQVSIELDRLFDLLAKKHIAVDFSADYDDRTKYGFIVDELFEEETEDMRLMGMTTHFNYEEFHPNHQLDIGNRADEFITGWFKKSLDKGAWCFGDLFILPDRRTLSKTEVAEKIKTIFDLYGPFTDCDYKIMDISFQLNENGGIGHAEGLVKYKAMLENNEQVDIRGPFKLYMSCQGGWWTIFHLVFPGFGY